TGPDSSAARGASPPRPGPLDDADRGAAGDPAGDGAQPRARPPARARRALAAPGRVRSASARPAHELTRLDDAVPLLRGECCAPMPDEDPTERRPLELDVTAWSLEQANRLIEGSSVELNGDGALLRLPGIGPADVHLDIRLALPDRGLFTPATVVGRETPDLVEIAFDWVDAYERGRLRAFVRNAK